MILTFLECNQLQRLFYTRHCDVLFIHVTVTSWTMSNRRTPHCNLCCAQLIETETPILHRFSLSVLSTIRAIHGMSSREKKKNWKYSSQSIASYAIFAVDAAKSEPTRGQNGMISLIPIQAISPRSRWAPLRAPVMFHLSHLRKPLYGMSIEESLAIAVREKDGHRIPVQWRRRRRSRDRQTYFPRHAVHRRCTSLCASQTRAPRLHQEPAIRKNWKCLDWTRRAYICQCRPQNWSLAEILFEAYPLLKETPSFTLMVTDAKSTRQLIPLSRPYTTKHLQKSCQHQIIYVRPSSSIGSSDSLTSESESDDDEVRNARASRKIIKRELSPERYIMSM